MSMLHTIFSDRKCVVQVSGVYHTIDGAITDFSIVWVGRVPSRTAKGGTNDESKSRMITQLRTSRLRNGLWCAQPSYTFPQICATWMVNRTAGSRQMSETRDR